MLMDEEFTASLRNAQSVDEFMEIIDKADDEKKILMRDWLIREAQMRDRVKILAVTSCPTGIAHTYMAAEGIEKAAKARNCFIKVETRGSGGAKTFLQIRRSRRLTALSWRRMHRFPWNVLMERS